MEEIPDLINLGLVYDDRNRVLMIRRKVEETGKNGSILRWAFPGGKQGVKETPAECVEREILLETGYAVETVKEISRRKHPHFPVTIIYHLCRLKPEVKRQKPQETHEVARIQWFKPQDVPKIITTDLDLMVAQELAKLVRND